ncbi:MAG: PP2C family protein-serine/threonine phosphatase [Nitrospira sp.]
MKLEVDYFDFIDVSAISPQSLLVAVGDVMGHGVPSSLVMATARAALRSNVLRKDPLADLMTRTNHVLSADNRHNRFMTLSLLLIDAETRIVKWASGGHDPAIVFEPDTQSLRELTARMCHWESPKTSNTPSIPASHCPVIA